MTPDYDLSNLPDDQADLCFYLRVDAILDEIIADQPERRTSPLALSSTEWYSPLCACEIADRTQQYITGNGLISIGGESKEVN